MKHYLNKLLAHEALTFDESDDLITQISTSKIAPEIIASILMLIEQRGPQMEEILGFRSALLNLTDKIPFDTSTAIDLCGTGGDGKNTFNISTTTSLILAAMGEKVVKHGNFGISSSCGSSNVLNELGFEFHTDSSKLERDLQNTNFCFLHAPLFHSSLKNVAEIRKNLGVRTIFNLLGPLINPAQPGYQFTGTYSLELAKIYNHILYKERKNYKVVYGLSGFDELTLSDKTRIYGRENELTKSHLDYQIPLVKYEEILSGKTVSDSAKLIHQILKGNGSEDQNNVIAANLAEAKQIIHPEIDIIETFNESLDFIKSGQGAKHFKFN